MNSASHYGAMAVIAAGELGWRLRERPVPGDGEVLLQVEACGICGADLSDIARPQAATERRVPGHEVVGRILERGPGVPARWEVGQRVGIGRLGGHCNACDACRGGQFTLCANQPVVGVSQDGGYAELMLARATGLVSIPEELGSLEAAPVLCAGLATFNALRRCGADPGGVVAIHGIGGLGHMAVQYARRMGFKVVAIGRGADIAEAALTLGAHAYLDTAAIDAGTALKGMGGAQALITTVGDPRAVEPLLPALAPGGTLVVLGVGKEPLAVASGLLVGGERTVRGSLTGSPLDSEKALAFSALTGALPWVTRMPLQEAPAALELLRSGRAQFRLVLTPSSAELP